MAVVDTMDMINVLEKKGFRRKKNKDVMFYFHFEGNESALGTMVSHGRGDIDDYLLGKMSRQMRITKSQLMKFVNCSLSEEAYGQDLKSRGQLDKPYTG